MPEKLALAQQQLETAIGLFVSRRDRVSAITLAGAADGILHGLVIKAGKAPFADYAMEVREALSGETPAKAKFARHNEQPRSKLRGIEHPSLNSFRGKPRGIEPGGIKLTTAP